MFSHVATACLHCSLDATASTGGEALRRVANSPQEHPFVRMQKGREGSCKETTDVGRLKNENLLIVIAQGTLSQLISLVSPKKTYRKGRPLKITKVRSKA